MVFHVLMHFSHVLHGVFLIWVMLRMMMFVHDDVFAIRGLAVNHLLDFFLMTAGHLAMLLAMVAVHVAALGLVALVRGVTLLGVALLVASAVLLSVC